MLLKAKKPFANFVAISGDLFFFRCVKEKSSRISKDMKTSKMFIFMPPLKFIPVGFPNTSHEAKFY